MNFVKLQDVILSCDSGTWGNDPADGVSASPVLRSSNIHDFKLTLDEFAWREIPIMDLERKKLQNGDIIITASSGSPDLIGKCAYFSQPNNDFDYYFSNFTLRLRGNEKVIFPKFLFYWLISKQARSYLKGANDTTSGLRNLNKKLYLKQPIPFPPLPEQKRIAEVLDKADALREKRRLALHKLDALLQSVFLEMFGDPVKNPKGLTKKTLGELIKVKSGAFLPEKSFNKTGSIPVYGGNGISGYHNEFMFDRPMLVIGRVGVYCGAVHLTSAFSWITDNALYISEKSDELDETYLFYALKQAKLNQYAGRFAQPLVSGSRIYPVSIIVPPMDLQNKFALIIEKIKDLEIKETKASDKAENLFQSLQQRAFKGELFSDESLTVKPQEGKVWGQTSLF